MLGPSLCSKINRITSLGQILFAGSLPTELKSKSIQVLSKVDVLSIWPTHFIIEFPFNKNNNI